MTDMDSPEDALKRITAALIKYREQTTIAYPLIVEVKERELWKLKYSSFKEFCIDGIGFSEQWAYALLKAGQVAKLVESKSAKNKEILANLTPRQAEKLEGLKPDTQAAVFDKAVEIAGGESPTPKEIQEARAAMIKSEPAKSEAPSGRIDETHLAELNKYPGEKWNDILTQVDDQGDLPTVETVRKAAAKLKIPAIKVYKEPIREAIQQDKVGRVIPSTIVELWNRAEALSVQMTDWSGKLKTEFKKAQDNGDILFAEHSANEFFGVMMKVKWACKDLRGYAVCTECEGRTPQKCTFCKGRGFISKFRWEQSSDVKRAAILKSVAAMKK